MEAEMARSDIPSQNANSVLDFPSSFNFETGDDGFGMLFADSFGAEQRAAIDSWWNLSLASSVFDHPLFPNSIDPSPNT